MKRLIIYLALIPFLAFPAYTKVKVVASTPDLAAIAQMIAGDQIVVETILRSGANPHYVEVLPSYMVKVSRADLYLKVGMDLDYWAQAIIDGSRNAKLVMVDCSLGITPLEVPTSIVDASMGDIHPQGNPHYWLDPRNGRVIAENIAKGLSQVDPEHRAQYELGLARFKEQLHQRWEQWTRQAEALRELEIVTFHNSWIYLAHAFGLKVVGFIEPKPGIEPTPSHTVALIELLKSRQVKIIGLEPYFSDRVPRAIAAATGAKVVILSPSAGSAETGDYFQLFDALLAKLLSVKGGE